MMDIRECVQSCKSAFDKIKKLKWNFIASKNNSLARHDLIDTLLIINYKSYRYIEKYTVKPLI